MLSRALFKMCTHDLSQTQVTETRRDEGNIYRRRKCACGVSIVTEEKRCAGMPDGVNAKSLARLHAHRGKRPPAPRDPVRLDWKAPT